MEKKCRDFKSAQKFAAEIRKDGGNALATWVKSKGWVVHYEKGKKGNWGVASKKHLARRIKTSKAIKRKGCKRK